MPNSSPLQWLFELVDRMSGPAQKIEKSLQGVDKSLEHVGKHSKESEGLVQRFADKVKEANHHAANEAIEGLASKFAGIAIAFQAAEAVGELVEKLVELGVELVADTLKAATFEQRTDIIFKTLAGSSELAEEATHSAKKFALESGIALDQVVGSYQKLMLAGASLHNIPIELQAATDIGFLSGRGNGARDQILETFSRIQQSGKLTSREFAAFKGVGIAGFDELAKKLGFTETEMGRFKGSAVEGHKAMQIILEAIAKTEGGSLGQVTKDLGSTLPGLFEKAKTSWDLVLGSVEKTEGFHNLVHVVEKLVALLDPDGPTGKKLIDQLGKAASAMGEFLEPFTKPGVIQHWMDVLIDGLHTAKSAMDGLITVFDVLTGRALVKAVQSVAKSTSSYSIEKNFEHAGTPEQLEAYRKAFSPDNVPGAASRKLASGTFAEGGIVDRPTLALVGEGGEPEHIIPESKMQRGGGGVTVHLQQSFHVAAEAGVSAGEIARKIHAIGVGELQAAFDSLALSMGTT